MKAQLLMLSAVGLLMAGAAHAQPPEVRRFLDDGRAAAEAKLAQSGVDLSGQTVAVRAVVTGEGRLNNLRVVRSTGSLEKDAAVAQALHRLRVEAPPVMLSGAEVTLMLGAAAPATAARPTAATGGGA